MSSKRRNRGSAVVWYSRSPPRIALFPKKLGRDIARPPLVCPPCGVRASLIPLTGTACAPVSIYRESCQARVRYRETHVLLDDLAESVVEGTRREFMEELTKVPLLIIDDFGMRKLPVNAAEDLLEIIMCRYERASTLLTSNRPVEDWGKLLADAAAVGAMLDRLLHHGHVLKCGPRSWRTKAPPVSEQGP